MLLLDIAALYCLLKMPAIGKRAGMGPGRGFGDLRDMATISRHDCVYLSRISFMARCVSKTLILSLPKLRILAIVSSSTLNTLCLVDCCAVTSCALLFGVALRPLSKLIELLRERGLD